jgi:hypothetical protein
MLAHVHCIRDYAPEQTRKMAPTFSSSQADPLTTATHVISASHTMQSPAGAHRRQMLPQPSKTFKAAAGITHGRTLLSSSGKQLSALHRQQRKHGNNVPTASISNKNSGH